MVNTDSSYKILSYHNVRWDLRHDGRPADQVSEMLAVVFKERGVQKWAWSPFNAGDATLEALEALALLPLPWPESVPEDIGFDLAYHGAEFVPILLGAATHREVWHFGKQGLEIAYNAVGTVIGTSLYYPGTNLLPVNCCLEDVLVPPFSSYLPATQQELDRTAELAKTEGVRQPAYGYKGF